MLYFIFYYVLEINLYAAVTVQFNLIFNNFKFEKLAGKKTWKKLNKRAFTVALYQQCISHIWNCTFSPHILEEDKNFTFFFQYHQRNNRIIKNESHFGEWSNKKKERERDTVMLVMKNVSTDFSWIFARLKLRENVYPFTGFMFR